jgi:hypothetical protein
MICDKYRGKNTGPQCVNKYEHQYAVIGEKLFTNKFANIKLYTYWVSSTILESLYSWELQRL